MRINEFEPIYHHEKYGDYEVIEDLGCSYIQPNGKNVHVARIRFLNTGYETVCFVTHIKAGKVRDPYARVIFNVACYGVINKDTVNLTNDEVYKYWYNMVSMCYNPKDNRFPYYGAKGVTICYDWLCFEYFVNYLISINMLNPILNKQSCEIVLLNPNLPARMQVISPQMTMFRLAIPYVTPYNYNDYKGVSKGDRKVDGTFNYCETLYNSAERSPISRATFNDPYQAAVYREFMYNWLPNAIGNHNDVPHDIKAFREAQKHRCGDKNALFAYHDMYKLAPKDYVPADHPMKFTEDEKYNELAKKFYNK